MRKLSGLIVLLLVVFVLIDILLAFLYFFPHLQDKTKSLIPGSKPGNCLVLEQRYCNTGEKLMIQNKFPMIGFVLPTNTSIFSPFDGKISHSGIIMNSKRVNGKMTGVPAITITSLKNDRKITIALSNSNTLRSISVKKGDLLLKTTSVNLDEKHNVIIGIYVRIPAQGPIFYKPDLDYIKQLFNL